MKKGYTIVETLISSLIFTIFFFLVIDFTLSSMEKFKRTREDFSVYSDAELGFTIVGRVLRKAGMFSGSIDSITLYENGFAVKKGLRECYIKESIPYGENYFILDKGCAKKGEYIFFDKKFYKIIDIDNGKYTIEPSIEREAEKGSIVSIHKNYDFFLRDDVFYIKIGNSSPQKLILNLKTLKFFYENKIFKLEGSFTNGKEFEFYVFTPFIEEVL